jgi:hypothetical protein
LPETFDSALNFFIACKNDDENEYWRILTNPLEKFGAFWHQHLEDITYGYGIVSYCTAIRPLQRYIINAACLLGKMVERFREQSEI